MSATSGLQKCNLKEPELILVLHMIIAIRLGSWFLGCTPAKHGIHICDISSLQSEYGFGVYYTIIIIRNPKLDPGPHIAGLGSDFPLPLHYSIRRMIEVGEGKQEPPVWPMLPGSSFFNEDALEISVI